MKITYNGAEILNKIKEKLQCNVIEINIKSNHNGQMEFINYFSAKYDNNKFIENNNYQIKIYVNDEEMTDLKKIIEVYKNEQYIIKIKYPLDFNDYCDGMFKGIDQIEYVKFYNFKGCKSTIQMFKECSSLEILNLSLFNFSQVSDMTEMFSNSKKLSSIDFPNFILNDSIVLNYMFCNCNSLKDINKSKFTNIAFKCSYKLEEDTTFYIEEENKYVKTCKNTDYPFINLQNKTCKQYCSNLFFIDDNNNSICLENNLNCSEIEEYSFFIKNKNQCIKNCSLDENYKFTFNNNCYFQCPNNSYSNKENKCECLYKYYYNNNNELICLNENENCGENFKFIKENSNQCLEKCPNNTYIFNSKCLSKCENEKKISENGKECECKYKYYKNNTLLNCLYENETCPSKLPFLNKENNECVNKCHQNDLIFNN